MSGGGTQKSLRKALGALKDTTTVSLAKVNSDYKELDIAIVKATNHFEHLAKEKHIRGCIENLNRYSSSCFEGSGPPTFPEEVINYGRNRIHMLNMVQARMVHSYALFLEERLECFRVLKYDVETAHLPQGAAVHNFMIQLALSLIASESIKIYQAISDGTINMVDKLINQLPLLQLKQMELQTGNWHLLLLQAQMKAPLLLANWLEGWKSLH